MGLFRRGGGKYQEGVKAAAGVTRVSVVNPQETTDDSILFHNHFLPVWIKQ